MVQVELTMPFHRGRMAPIQSNKNIVDSTGGLSVVADSVNVFVNVHAQGVPTNNTDSVPSGAKITSLFISLFIIGSTGSVVPLALDWYLGKARAGQVIATDFPSPGATGLSPVRNQIFHEEKGLSGTQDGTPMAFKGVIRVPRGAQRCREGDLWFIKIRGVDDYTFCLKVLYKYFT